MPYAKIINFRLHQIQKPIDLLNLPCGLIDSSISRHLNLTGASIVNISLDAFRGLGGLRGLYDPKNSSQNGLKTLSLAYNALDKFPSKALARGLSNLQSLLIGGNFIERLASEDLKGLAALENLDLSNSPNLVHLGSNLLSGNPMMGTVSVSSCPQLSVQNEIFQGLQGSLRLRLDDLGWTQVPLELADWTKVVSIDLDHNPLECDCKLLWLKDWLEDRMRTENETVEENVVICQQPYTLKGRPLQVIDFDAHD